LFFAYIHIDGSCVFETAPSEDKYLTLFTGLIEKRWNEMKVWKDPKKERKKGEG
jgi:hypothetical protein